MPTRFYYDEVNDNSYLNTFYASDIALETHFANMLFKGSLDRIVYASNDYAFRKRAGSVTSDYTNLEFPFMNYYNPQVVNPDTDRFYWNHIANIEGIYSSELGRKIRVVPLRIEYESSIWFNSAFDLQYAMSRLNNNDSNETVVYATVTTTDGQDITIPMFLGYNFSDNVYQEDDFLEQNRIYNQGINFTVDLVMLYDDSPVSITDEIIFNFLSSKNLDTSDPINSDPQKLLTQYFTEGDLT
ncbi:MAG: hypothetical protein PF569_10310 [Candidatus Woesearchaeota archaeon]|jgi:hypothetical protein|nr:hypothetical protein [Candidatus Woesearchaeota archaeon]